jgi:Mg/Co/Ni transporter MgtE
MPSTELANLVWRLSGCGQAGATLADLTLPDQVCLFRQMEQWQALRLLEAMEPGRAADLLAVLLPIAPAHT